METHTNLTLPTRGLSIIIIIFYEIRIAMNYFTNISLDINILYYYPYRAFGGQNKIVYSTRFVRRAIFF